MNFRVIDIANGSEPTEHETLEDAIKSAQKLTVNANDDSTSWIIEDWTNEVVWSSNNEI